jgi:hypothetical protein
MRNIQPPLIGEVEDRTALIVEKSQLREPNLLIPGKKPIGPVKIDWSNPIAQGLVVFSIFNERKWTGSLLNLADGTNPGVISGTAAAVNPYTESFFGVRLKFHPSGNTGIDELFYEKDNVIANTDDVTMISKGVVESNSGDQASFGWRGLGGDSFRLIQSDNSTFTAAYIDSSPVAQHSASITTATVSDGSTVTTCGRKKGNLLRAFHRLEDGKINTSSDTTGGSGNMRDDGNGNHITPSNAVNTKGNNAFYYFAAWNRALSDAEVTSVMLDPYQFLVPA